MMTPLLSDVPANGLRPAVKTSFFIVRLAQRDESQGVGDGVTKSNQDSVRVCREPAVFEPCGPLWIGTQLESTRDVVASLLPLPARVISTDRQVFLPRGAPT